jgi:hypothetical protein
MNPGFDLTKALMGGLLAAVRTKGLTLPCRYVVAEGGEDGDFVVSGEFERDAAGKVVHRAGDGGEARDLRFPVDIMFRDREERVVTLCFENALSDPSLN